jgi:hypothetical protein
MAAPSIRGTRDYEEPSLSWEHSSQYDACPSCGGVKRTKATTCKACQTEYRSGNEEEARFLARWAMAEHRAGRPVVLVIPEARRAAILDGLRELLERFGG